MSNLLPPGTYLARAVQQEVDGTFVFAQFSESSNGNEQAQIQFEIAEGEHAGRKLLWWGSFSDNAFEITMKALRVMGFKGTNLLELPTQSIEQEVNLVVIHDDYGGTTKAKVQWVNSPNGGGGTKVSKSVDGDKLRMFAAKMAARAAKFPEVQGQPAAARAPATGGRDLGIGDDGVPF
jgi:hypothetical protein